MRRIAPAMFAVGMGGVLVQDAEASHVMASVRFSGLIREAAGADAEAFGEVWHSSKPVDGSRGRCIAGIRQC